MISIIIAEKYLYYLRLVVIFAILFAVILLLSGAMYIVYHGNIPFVGSYGERFYFYAPFTLSDQLVAEGVFVALLITLGSLGFTVIYLSIQKMQKAFVFRVMFFSGLTLLVISILFTELLFRMKIYGGLF